MQPMRTAMATDGFGDTQRDPTGFAPTRGTTSRATRRSLLTGMRGEAAIGSAVSVLLGGGIAWVALTLTTRPLLATASIGVLAVVAAAWSWMRVGRNLGFMVELTRAAEDLSSGKQLKRVDESKLGGFAVVGESFNKIFSTLGAVAHEVLAIVSRVQDLPERITLSLDEISASAEAQEEAVEEAASLMANINSSIRNIDMRVDNLARAADESASSILQMGSSVEEVARNAGALQESVENSTSSVHEMSASIRQVADSSERVQRIAEETASSMVEMDRTVQAVGGHVQQASELTDKVTESAKNGANAVDETIRDIERIHALTSDSKAGLEKLVGRIGEIAGILDVIGEINDETNLLSLNAAIIAAQAGEQGKAFLVVANHVKTLAQRTAASTKGIEQLLHAVEEESENAKTAMDAGIEAIEQGVSRSRLAGRSLKAIQDSAQESSQRVAEIARASEEQTRTSALVARAAQETSSQVQQISTAMGEQTKASEQMLKSSEAALELCRHVYRSIDEQRETGRYITQAISQITEMIRLIKENTADHGQASEAVNEAVLRLLENARKSGEQLPAVNALMSELRDSAESIVGELSRFEIAPGAFDA